jgi:hypothetical protein
VLSSLSAIVTALLAFYQANEALDRGIAAQNAGKNDEATRENVATLATTATMRTRRRVSRRSVRFARNRDIAFSG